MRSPFNRYGRLFLKAYCLTNVAQIYLDCGDLRRTAERYDSAAAMLREAADERDQALARAARPHGLTGRRRSQHSPEAATGREDGERSEAAGDSDAKRVLQ